METDPLSKTTRPLLPKPRGDEAPSTSVPLKRKRDRALAACENCRKRKIKCDSSRPACVPCRASHLACVYPVPEGMTQRAAQRQQLEHAANLRMVLDLLRTSSGKESMDITRRIREAPSLDAAVELIKDAVLLMPPVSPVTQPGLAISGLLSIPMPTSPVGPSSLSDRSVRPWELSDHHSTSPRGQANGARGSPDGLQSSSGDSDEPPPAAAAAAVLPVSRWTSVPKDDIYLTHLLRLFWTWDQTVSRVVDRGVFYEALEAPGAQDAQFCSRFLVNCMLAVATLLVPQEHPVWAEDSASHSGRPFADEAFDLLGASVGRPSITQVQGLAMLWVFEATAGTRARTALLLDRFFDAHGRLNLDVDLTHLGPLSDPAADRKWEAISLICWGLYVLQVKIALAFSRRPLAGLPRIAKAFESPDSTLASVTSGEHLWSPYPSPSQAMPSRLRETFCAECVLAELANQVLAEADACRRGPAPGPGARLRALYAQLLEWKASLPTRLQDYGRAPPAVIFLHVTFDMVVLALLEPFSSQSPNPEADATAAAAAGLSLSHGAAILSALLRYRATYGPGHDYWLAHACYAAAGAALPYLGGGSAVAADTFASACHLLRGAAGRLPLAAADLLLLLRARLRRGGAAAPPAAAAVLEAAAGRGRTTYVRGARLALPLRITAGAGGGEGGGRGGHRRGARAGGSAAAAAADGVYTTGAAPMDVAFSSFIIGVGEPTGSRTPWQYS